MPRGGSLSPGCGCAAKAGQGPVAPVSSSYIFRGITAGHDPHVMTGESAELSGITGELKPRSVTEAQPSDMRQGKVQFLSGLWLKTAIIIWGVKVTRGVMFRTQEAT